MRTFGKRRERPASGRVARLLLLLQVAAAGFVGGCKVVNVEEAEAKRREQLRETHPSLYEIERAETDRQREDNQAYQDYLDRRQH